MNDWSDIEMIWRTADVSRISEVDSIQASIRTYRHKIYWQYFAQVLIVLILILVLRWVFYNYDYRLWTTPVGMCCMLIAIVIFTFIKIRSFVKVMNAKNQSNDAFLEQMKKRHTVIMHQTSLAQLVGFIIAVVGLLLYLYEIVLRNVLLLVVGYAFASIWILGCWFIIRPKILKRKKEQLQLQIQKLENISAQLRAE